MESLVDGVSGLAVPKTDATSGINQGTLRYVDIRTLGSNKIKVSSSSQEKLLEEAVQKFMQPLKTEILNLKQKVDQHDNQEDLKKSAKTRPVPVKLLQGLCHFIWEPDLIYSHKGLLHRIYKSLNYNFTIENGQSDLDDYLEYKCSEMLGYKATQVFIALVLPDPPLFFDEMRKFKELIEDRRVSMDSRAEAAFRFLYDAFQMMYDILADEYVEKDGGVPDYLNLSIPSKCFVRGVSVYFIKQFRLMPKERTDKIRKVIEEDPSSVEWCLCLAEILRLKRRESAMSRPQWQTKEEMDLVAAALSMDPENPFVRLTVIDTIIGSVRDANGRFKCGDIYLDDLDEAMRYLHANCQKLVADFPNNVMFNSIISDYFARYVPLLYFDINYSFKLLEAAYKLNESNPKTTHRLGIFHRMSLKDINESLKWFEKTIQLDPYHFQATMEYFKTIMGKVDQYDVAQLMHEKLESPESKGWNPLERADFYFFLGLAHFVKGEREDTLTWWTKMAEINEYPLTLVDLQDTFEFYEWDCQLVSSDKLRLWIKDEKDKIAAKEKANETVDPVRSKFVNRLFAFMLGRARPFRAPIANNAHPVIFPKQYWEHFADI